MGNHIHGHVGYGLILGDEGMTEELAAFGDRAEKLLDELYPEGKPELEIAFHFIRAPDGSADDPLVLIREESEQVNDVWEFTYGQTYSAGGADDFSGFLQRLGRKKDEWDARIAEFVRRCGEHGIKIRQTKPHPILYLTWDDGIMGRGVTRR